MTYREILAAMEGNQRRIKSELQIQASLIYRLGSLIGWAVNDPKNYPSYQKAFPFAEGDSVQKQDWQRMKANIEAYAAERKKRGENNGNND